MTTADKVSVLLKLRDYLLYSRDSLDELVSLAKAYNPWFTVSNIHLALDGIVESYLHPATLNRIVDKYVISNVTSRKRIGLIMAGNIPLVGFHDILCTFLADHICLIKYSEKDKVLLQHLITKLNEYDQATKPYFEEIQRLTAYDAVIATGSNNAAMHFETYFAHVPHIIRRNRNGVGVLDGKESKQDIIELGKDIFTYYGLGCRNVSHIKLPRGYDLTFLLEILHDHYKEMVMHHKYKNNFDFHFATLSMNRVPFLMSGSLIITEQEQIPSKIAILHYTYYDTNEELQQWLDDHSKEIQCLVSNQVFEGIPSFKFGHAQAPDFLDYADGVDTIQFLLTV